MPTFIHAQPLEEVNRCHGPGRGHPCTGGHDWVHGTRQGTARCAKCGASSTFERLNHMARMRRNRDAAALSRKQVAERELVTVYHVTLPEHLEAIKGSGLDPNASSHGRVFFTDLAGVAPISKLWLGGRGVAVPVTVPRSWLTPAKRVLIGTQRGRGVGVVEFRSGRKIRPDQIGAQVQDTKESNNCHNPGGSPVGGQFCASPGGRSGSPQHLAAIQKARDYSPTVVGITSYTPGRTNRQVFSEIHDFEDRLRAIPTVINVKVAPALGAYKGAWEPSWSVYYEGNGAARKLMAHMGQKYGQQNVVIFKAGGTEPLHDITFDRPAGARFIKAMNRMLGRMGFGGWTWFKQGGKSVLRMGYVPEWPTDTIKSPDDFRRLAGRVSSLLQKHGRTHRVEAVGVKVEVFGKENYEKVVRGHA